MNSGVDEIGFNEEKARELVYYLLENDTSVFKKLIPEIRAMDSESFENLFKGTPFKGENNRNGYDYNIHNKKQFEHLLDKFDNFWIILDGWYLDKNFYKYLKDLWINYISIEKLPKNDHGIESFLKSNDIDYKNWPDNIKEDFKMKIRATKKTRILDPQKAEEFEKHRSELKKLMNKLKDFKNKIKNKPEMKTYEENTDKQIEKLKTNGLKYLKTLFQNLTSGKTGNILSILGTASTAIPIIYSNESLDPNCCKENQEILNNNDYYDDNDFYFDDEKSYDDDDEKNSLDKVNLNEQLQNLFDNNLFCSVHIILSFLNLGWSVYEFCKAYKDLKQVKQNVKILENDLKIIKSNFNKHKEKIGILPDDFKESLEKIKEVYSLICQDYNQLEVLIKKIHENMKIANEHKNKSTFGLISSGILGFTGVAGGILIRNGNAIWYGISAISNTLTAIGHTIVLTESQEMIKDLNHILEDAMIQRKKILDEMDNLIMVVSNMEKGQIPKLP